MVDLDANVCLALVEMAYFVQVSLTQHNSRIQIKLIKQILDIDECKYELDNCAWNKICHNTIGSFECLCQDGFKSAENNKCIGKLIFQKI